MATPAEILAEAARRRLGLQSAADLTSRRLNEDYDVVSGKLGHQKGQAEKSVADNFAARGMFNSGIRVNEQGEVGRTYATAIDDALRGRNRGLEDVQFNLSSGMSDIENWRMGEEASFTAQQAQAELQRQLVAAQIAAAQRQAEYMSAQLKGMPQPYRPLAGSAGANLSWGSYNPIDVRSRSGAPARQAAQRHVGRY